MLRNLTGRPPAAILDLANYELELENRFEGPVLDRRLWIPYYLPHWSSPGGGSSLCSGWRNAPSVHRS